MGQDRTGRNWEETVLVAGIDPANGGRDCGRLATLGLGHPKRVGPEHSSPRGWCAEGIGLSADQEAGVRD